LSFFYGFEFFVFDFFVVWWIGFSGSGLGRPAPWKRLPIAALPGRIASERGYHLFVGCKHLFVFLFPAEAFGPSVAEPVMQRCGDDFVRLYCVEWPLFSNLRKSVIFTRFSRKSGFFSVLQ